MRCPIFRNAFYDRYDTEPPNETNRQGQWAQTLQYRESAGRNKLQDTDTGRRNQKQPDHLTALAG